MKQYPKAVVGAFIRNKKGEILLVKSFKWREGKVWEVPGGHVDWGESIEQAVKREVKEEVGLEVEFLRVFAVWDAIFPKDYYLKKHFIFLECECRMRGKQKVKIDEDEIQRAEWFGLEQAFRLRLESFTRKSFKRLYG